MKRLMSLLLALVMVLGMIPAVATAETTSAEIYFVPNYAEGADSIAPGEAFTVDVMIKNNPGFAALGGEFTYKSVILEEIDAAGALLNGVIANNGMIAFYGTTDVTGDGKLCTLEFSTLSTILEGDYEISLEIEEMCNAAAKDLEVNVKPGSVKVVKPETDVDFTGAHFAVDVWDISVSPAVQNWVAFGDTIYMNKGSNQGIYVQLADGTIYEDLMCTDWSLEDSSLSTKNANNGPVTFDGHSFDSAGNHVDSCTGGQNKRHQAYLTANNVCEETLTVQLDETHSISAKLVVLDAPKYIGTLGTAPAMKFTDSEGVTLYKRESNVYEHEDTTNKDYRYIMGLNVGESVTLEAPTNWNDSCSLVSSNTDVVVTEGLKITVVGEGQATVQPAYKKASNGFLDQTPDYFKSSENDSYKYVIDVRSDGTGYRAINVADEAGNEVAPYGYETSKGYHRTLLTVAEGQTKKFKVTVDGNLSSMRSGTINSNDYVDISFDSSTGEITLKGKKTNVDVTDYTAFSVVANVNIPDAKGSTKTKDITQWMNVMVTEACDHEDTERTYTQDAEAQTHDVFCAGCGEKLNDKPVACEDTIDGGDGLCDLCGGALTCNHEGTENEYRNDAEAKTHTEYCNACNQPIGEAEPCVAADTNNKCAKCGGDVEFLATNCFKSEIDFGHENTTVNELPNEVTNGSGRYTIVVDNTQGDPASITLQAKTTALNSNDPEIPASNQNVTWQLYEQVDNVGTITPDGKITWDGRYGMLKAKPVQEDVLTVSGNILLYFTPGVANAVTLKVTDANGNEVSTTEDALTIDGVAQDAYVIQDGENFTLKSVTTGADANAAKMAQLSTWGVSSYNKVSGTVDEFTGLDGSVGETLTVSFETYHTRVDSSSDQPYIAVKLEVLGRAGMNSSMLNTTPEIIYIKLVCEHSYENVVTYEVEEGETHTVVTANTCEKCNKVNGEPAHQTGVPCADEDGDGICDYCEDTVTAPVVVSFTHEIGEEAGEATEGGAKLYTGSTMTLRAHASVQWEVTGDEGAITITALDNTRSVTAEAIQVTANQPGTAVITATPAKGTPATYTIAVEDKEPAPEEPNNDLTAAIAAGTDSVKKGETVNVSVFVEPGTDKTSYNAYEITVSYDKDQLTYTGSSFDDTGDTKQSVVKDNGDGTLLVYGYGAKKDASADAALVTLNFTANATGTAAVSVTNAKASDSEAATTENLQEISISEQRKTDEIAIYEEYKVTFTEEVTVGTENVMEQTYNTIAHANGMQFTVVPKSYHDQVPYTVVTSNGTLSNEGNTYTLTGLTEDTTVTITHTPNTYTVSYTGNGADDVTSDTTATYGEPFTVTINEASGWEYTVTANVDISNRVISGDKITQNITVTVTKRAVADDNNVLVQIYKNDVTNEADNVSAPKGAAYTFSIPAGYKLLKVEMGNGTVNCTEANGSATTGVNVTGNLKIYFGKIVEVKLPQDDSVVDAEGNPAATEANYGDPYTFFIADNFELDKVKIGETEYTFGDEGCPITQNIDGSYTIPADAITGDIEIKTKAADYKVSVHKYVQGNGKDVMLVLAGVEKEEGKVLTYDGNPMYWSPKYPGYAYLVFVAGTTSFTEDTAKPYVKKAVGAPAGEIDYSGNVNKSSETDLNDAQLTYDIYNVMYNEFTADVTMEKFLRADVNASKNVDVQDAIKIVNQVRGENTNS